LVSIHSFSTLEHLQGLL